MFEQKFEPRRQHTPGSTSLADAYARGQAAMDRLCDSEQLKEAVDAVLAQLPGGPVTLISTSVQGAGLAAACAAVREQPTRWGAVNPMLSSPAVIGDRIVVVEALDAGAVWRDALLRRFPGAAFAFADASAAAPPLAA